MRQTLKQALLLSSLLAAWGCDDTLPAMHPSTPPVSSSSSSPATPSVSDPVTLAMTAVRPAYQRFRIIGEGTDLKLHAWWSDQSDGDVGTPTWRSEDTSIATVDDTGRVTAVGKGVTLIHGAYQNDDATVMIEVNPQPQTGGTGNPPPGGTGGNNPPPDTGPHEDPPPSAQAPYADRVVSYTVGDGGGFNEGKMPGIVLGPPKGAGLYQGSFDVFSLGVGGQIILEFTDYLVFDGPGDDFIVFENAFQIGSDPNATFAEPGVVSVSEDGVTYVDFPCNLSAPPYAGCAGVHPTLANPDTNTIDPTDPTVAGGDAFDLAHVGLKKARFVKIQDSGLGLGPIGPGTRGFDLDAIAIHHGTLP